MSPLLYCLHPQSFYTCSRFISALFLHLIMYIWFIHPPFSYAILLHPQFFYIYDVYISFLHLAFYICSLFRSVFLHLQSSYIRTLFTFAIFLHLQYFYIFFLQPNFSYIVFLHPHFYACTL